MLSMVGGRGVGDCMLLTLVKKHRKEKKMKGREVKRTEFLPGTE